MALLVLSLGLQFSLFCCCCLLFRSGWLRQRVSRCVLCVIRQILRVCLSFFSVHFCCIYVREFCCGGLVCVTAIFVVLVLFLLDLFKSGVVLSVVLCFLHFSAFFEWLVVDF